jgi:hypothetical protein
MYRKHLVSNIPNTQPQQVQATDTNIEVRKNNCFPQQDKIESANRLSKNMYIS